MERYKLGEMEKRFAEIIWARSPVTTKELVAICEKEFGWKRTTTYTMLKRLCDRGIFENKGGVVITLITKDEFTFNQSKLFVDETFSGSLPMFIAAFSKGKKLDKTEIERIQQLIDSYREDDDNG